MFSIVMPLEEDRIPLFENTVRAYQKCMGSITIEFVVPTRTIKQLYIPHITTVLVPYEHDSEYFNPALALNLGVAHSNYDNIIISCPEVMPLTNVLGELRNEVGNNIVCQVMSENEDESIGISLVNTKFRHKTPAMYFLALFNRKDLEAINGWDLQFMKGAAYEDTDFGARFVRAGLPFKVRDDIKALHQWHPVNKVSDGWDINRKIYESNNRKKITKCECGLNEI